MKSELGPAADLVFKARALTPVARSHLAEAVLHGTIDPTSASELRGALNVSTLEANSLGASASRTVEILGAEATRGVLLGACLGAPEPAPPQLVWTAPGAPAAARHTSEVVLDLVRGAERSLVIVGYSLTKAASPLLAELATATRRGVLCSIVVDRMEDKLATLFELWPADLGLPAMWSRLPDPSDEMSALHAKAVIVDRRRLLITSANLTYHGFHGNIELGVLLEGPVASAAEDLVREWTKAELIRRVGKPRA